jgi:hypothetical protein
MVCYLRSRSRALGGDDGLQGLLLALLGQRGAAIGAGHHGGVGWCRAMAFYRGLCLLLVRLWMAGRGLLRLCAAVHGDGSRRRRLIVIVVRKHGVRRGPSRREREVCTMRR